MTGVGKHTLKGEQINNGATGLKARGLLRIAANVADTETVTIGADVYEFDRAANGVTAGRIAVTGHADDTPAAASNALIVAINANANSLVDAIDLTDNLIMVVSKAFLPLTTAMSETMAGVNNTVDAALAGGAAETLDGVRGVSIVPTALEVVLGQIRIPLNFTPTGALVQVRDTGTGIAIAWVGTTTLDTVNNQVVIDNSGAVDWAVTDTVTVVVF